MICRSFKRLKWGWNTIKWMGGAKLLNKEIWKCTGSVTSQKLWSESRLFLQLSIDSWIEWMRWTLTLHISSISRKVMIRALYYIKRHCKSQNEAVKPQYEYIFSTLCSPAVGLIISYCSCLFPFLKYFEGLIKTSQTQRRREHGVIMQSRERERERHR